MTTFVLWTAMGMWQRDTSITGAYGFRSGWHTGQ